MQHMRDTYNAAVKSIEGLCLPYAILYAPLALIDIQ